MAGSELATNRRSYSEELEMMPKESPSQRVRHAQIDCFCGLFTVLWNNARREARLSYAAARTKPTGQTPTDRGDAVEVAKYATLPQFDASILDTYIPRYRRLTQLHFGAIVSNPHAPMAFKEKMGYNMTYNLVPPGNGNALHMHQSVEIFVALDGRWEIAYGMQGEHSAILEPWDFIACPARVCHSYKNITADTARNIMTILPGKSWITWAPTVVSEARSFGAECDDNGMLLKYARMTSKVENLASDADSVTWRHMGPTEMAPFVHSYREGRPLECEMVHGVADEHGLKPFIEMFWRNVPHSAPLPLPRKHGVDVLLVVLQGSIGVKTIAGDLIASAGKFDCVRVPAQAISSQDVIVHNGDVEEAVLLIVATQMRGLNDAYFHLC
eukprot:TRINITY_DN23046_c0_g1_i1.p1 TRINITY_DN23046_c0_g1~~TRINITY_DN23046_c0_g1_i1.p1  ORF type:complete len:411 (+),score=36.24 TRINITY_DN23046_c0_g1_i1:80-1234(+)